MSIDTINSEQCADLLQCTEATVEELTRKGELPGVKFGRGWIYVKASLLEYLAQKAMREAEERRLNIRERAQTPATIQVLRPKRKTPPVLPQPLQSITGQPSQRL